MAIIRPTRNFAGSEIESGGFSSYLKPSVRKAKFDKKDNNKDGAYLYFLPGYKSDHTGGGVWYRVINVRTNFGNNGSTKYHVPNMDTDPAEHFAKNYRRFFPEESKRKQTTSESGKTQWVYPAYGRIARRVLYNVVFAARLQDKGHVLDLPSYNGADNLDTYHRSKNVNGTERGLISDPDCCVPVLVQMTDSTNPWKILPAPDQAVVLPEEFRDVALGSFYNLDEVTVDRDPEAIIADLRNAFPLDVFNNCMSGYHGGSSSVPVQGFTAPAAVNPVLAAPISALPAAAPAPVASVPISSLPPASAPTQAAQPAALPSMVVNAIPKSLAPAIQTAGPATGPTPGMTPAEVMAQLIPSK